MEVPQIKANRKKGSEKFKYNGKVQKRIALTDFWKWSSSDLITNATRGVLAEFIVSIAINKHKVVRNEWDAYDLITKDGIKVEVKSAAYIQSWYQQDFSKILFSIPKTRGWDPKTNKLDKVSERHSDVYVFCLLDHLDYRTIDPLNLNQWKFFVISTKIIDKELGDKKSISLNKLKSLNPVECNYPRLNQYIKRAISK